MKPRGYGHLPSPTPSLSPRGLFNKTHLLSSDQKERDKPGCHVDVRDASMADDGRSGRLAGTDGAMSLFYELQLTTGSLDSWPHKQPIGIDAGEKGGSVTRP